MRFGQPEGSVIDSDGTTFTIGEKVTIPSGSRIPRFGLHAGKTVSWPETTRTLCEVKSETARINGQKVSVKWIRFHQSDTQGDNGWCLSRDWDRWRSLSQ